MERKEFSYRSRLESIKRFRNEKFDLLVVGGGITGAAVARDAVSRGLKVALVERNDFAFGTSSRSSKLIHGGLRYLQNMELGLVFEALAERAFLLKAVPHLVRPLPFYFPVYRQDSRGKGLMGLGLWLYDLLALFRTPGFHKGLSRKKVLEDIPFLRSEGLVGGFRYYDASMQDDVLVIETLRAAHGQGAAVANYVEALKPLWDGDRISGFRVHDKEDPSPSAEFDLRAHRTVICAGPWTDQVGETLSPEWRRWLTPSKGVHLVFDLARIPVPGALVMTHPEDGRIAFVIPRKDFGAGVAIVGTTDGPTSFDPDHAEVTRNEVDYLMGLLNRYLPDLKLTDADILSAYVGVRPLMGAERESSSSGKSGKNQSTETSRGQESASVLQKVSREHHIDRGPGGTVIVAGGKYTTHRQMAGEIVDLAIQLWKEDFKARPGSYFPPDLTAPRVDQSLNPEITAASLRMAQSVDTTKGLKVPEELLARYGLQAVEWAEDRLQAPKEGSAPAAGVEFLEERFKYSMQHEMVIHLEDFYFRRSALYMSRKDHGLPFVEKLQSLLLEENGKTKVSQGLKGIEIERLNAEILKRTAWQRSPNS